MVVLMEGVGLCRKLLPQHEVKVYVASLLVLLYTCGFDLIRVAFEMIWSKMIVSFVTWISINFGNLFVVD